MKKYKLKGLECAHCAQKMEERLNQLPEVKECSIHFATSLLFIDSDRYLSDEKILKVIQKIEPDVTIESKLDGLHHHGECGCECGCNHDDTANEVKSLKGLDVYTFTISNLDCANCAMKVEQAIQQMPMIKEAALSFATSTLQVKTNETMNDEQLIKQLEKTIDQVEKGVVIELRKANEIKQAKLFDFKQNWMLVLGIIIFIISLLIPKPYAIFTFMISYLLIGKNVLQKAFRNILKGEIFDENFLMSIASIGAFIIGEYSESVAVLMFYSIGELFQAYAVNKTRTSISSLMNLKSDFSNLKTANGIIEVNSEDVQIDDIIIVKVGEKIPLDGIIINGESTLDTSSLTGESLPKYVKEHDEVLAGMINLSNILEVKVSKTYANSTVAKIIEMIENASSKKAPIENFITRFAKIYTPIVCLCALLLAIIPNLIFKDAIFTDWLYRALTFLVVSCPCALVISIPLGLYAGLGKASKLGALIKGSNYLEMLKDIDTVVFDKTGTLTHGNFEVVETNGLDNILEIAAHGEYFSNHPIALSIVSAYKQEINQSRISNFKEIAGKGIEVNIDQKQVILGNSTFMSEKQIPYQVCDSIGTIVYVTMNQKVVGYIVVSDTIKESSIKGIQALKQCGIKNTIMLSGDIERVANHVASKLNIDKVYAQLLPQDKVHIVEQLLNTSKVAFVGDGINDAPVLARANIGIAMGGIGSDAAIEAADMVLMQDNIETIAKTIKLSKKTNHILKQNVTFTLVIKIGVLLLTMFGLSNMWMGVFADVGVTLIAILNSVRILK